MLRKTLAVMIISVIFSIFAVPVEINTAETAAKNWMKVKSENRSTGEISDYVLYDEAFYAFNFKSGGFVLIAADDASVPVLGYSLNGIFEADKEKANISFWLELYSKAIKEIRNKQLSSEPVSQEWKNILSGNITTKSSKAVEPLLSTTWNQSPIYNNYCPLDGGSLSVVGCVATAMAQIMNYHQYPEVGKSSSSYEVLGQTLSANYYLSKYNWDMMPNAISSGSSSDQIHEVAQISYHAGVAVEMDYGADGSGASSEDVPYALETYFKYNTSAIHEYRSSYTSTNWKNMLMDQIDRSLPVYYSGQGTDGGHAFVCDGYQDASYYHFNWGWGGSADGYYHIDNLNPGGSTFNEWQAVVREIKPKSKELSLNDPIDDVFTSDETYQINLMDHFDNFTTQALTFAIDASSELNGAQYMITDSILTLNKTGEGLSHIIITAASRNDNSFDEFYLKFGAGGILAGFGNSYDFNSAAYLNAGNAQVLNDMTKITFSTWLKLDTVGREHGIASKSESSNSGWSAIVQSNNIIKFSVKTQDGLTRRVYGIQTLKAEQWYHIDLVYDGKDLVIYINGNIDNIKTSYTAQSPMLHDTARYITLGYANGIYLDGQLDETILWDQPLSVSQIRDIMGKKPEMPDPKITAYWIFDEGFFDAAYDLTGVNDGLFVNNSLDYWTDSQAPQYFFMGQNVSLNGTLLGSYDATAVYSVTDGPSFGSFEITNSNSGDFTYTPQTDASGIDTIKYVITYGKAVTDEKTAIISVNSANGIDNSTEPSSVELYQNYPNPFNPVTQIGFTLNKAADVRLTVFNTSGQKVAELVKGLLNSGKHFIGFDAAGLNSGVYYYTLEAGGSKMTRKMVLTK
ncbi:MAG TPA: C10 family peptidase [Clostridiales bacterium]|nr:C10 family peptidase [Clostridiales bacterium]HQP69450.1 C10 family peptidase [Clostridiales bacterium]